MIELRCETFGRGVHRNRIKTIKKKWDPRELISYFYPLRLPPEYHLLITMQVLTHLANLLDTVVLDVEPLEPGRTMFGGLWALQVMIFC